jgi:RNA polymerase sigma-70 factor (ECF subfamily)
VEDVTALLLAGRAGDRLAMHAWVRRTQPDVWRLCSLLGDRDTVEDLVQETYLRAHKALPSFRAESSSRAWVLSIARRVCADAVRSRSRVRRLIPRLAERDEVPLASSAEVDDLLWRLDDDRRQAFVLTQLLGLSYQEAADVCRVPVGTIRSRVARARADLIYAVGDGASEAL